MKDFYGENLLLSSDSAKKLYKEVKDLPIIDYHCHLNENEIRENKTFADLGELWLSGDHYKWRAMRLCGVDEKYVTGDANYYEKYKKYAEIFPKLCGNPLYFWTQLELKLIFGITEPLNSESADRIWQAANEKLSGMTVGDILKKFRVEYVATTDDPVSKLASHGKYGGVLVRPTFRPDRILSFDESAIKELGEAAGIGIKTLGDLKKALEARLDFFISKGCAISDHGMDFLPIGDCGEKEAEKIFASIGNAGDDAKRALFSHLMYFLAGLYKDRGIVMQIHFATYRNVNRAEFAKIGKDSGFDIMRGEVNVDFMTEFLNTLTERNALPKTVLYSLNPACVPALATLSGAFRNVYVGSAWWFNDTVLGIKKQLETIAEYASLGTNPGMLTDSRSFASYARFDFFRRILADVVGGYVERGEYDLDGAKALMRDVCYNNVKKLLSLDNELPTKEKTENTMNTDTEKKYRYETHLHTSPVSNCARATVRETVEFYKKMNYDGIFVTNHFISSLKDGETYKDKLDFYFSDYDKAVEIGKELGIKVFLGTEISYGGTDFLIYGLGKDFYYAHPEILGIKMKNQLSLMHENGAFIIQAHPFREAGYIDHIRLFPRSIDGVEVINACRTDFENKMAEIYAENYGLLKSAGSDNHTASKRAVLAGVETAEPINSEEDFIRFVKEGKTEIFAHENELAN